MRQGMALMANAEKRAEKRRQEGRKKGGLHRGEKKDTGSLPTSKPLRSREDVAKQIGTSERQFDAARKLLTDLDNRTSPIGKLYEIEVLNLHAAVEAAKSIDKQNQANFVENVLRATSLDTQKELAKKLLGGGKKGKDGKKGKKEPKEPEPGKGDKGSGQEGGDGGKSPGEGEEEKQGDGEKGYTGTGDGTDSGGTGSPPTPPSPAPAPPPRPEEVLLQRMAEILGTLTKFLLDWKSASHAVQVNVVKHNKTTLTNFTKVASDLVREIDEHIS